MLAVELDKLSCNVSPPPTHRPTDQPTHHIPTFFSHTRCLLHRCSARSRLRPPRTCCSNSLRARFWPPPPALPTLPPAKPPSSATKSYYGCPSLWYASLASRLSPQSGLTRLCVVCVGAVCAGCGVLSGLDDVQKGYSAVLHLQPELGGAKASVTASFASELSRSCSLFYSICFIFPTFVQLVKPLLSCDYTYRPFEGEAAGGDHDREGEDIADLMSHVG